MGLSFVALEVRRNFLLAINHLQSKNQQDG